MNVERAQRCSLRVLSGCLIVSAIICIVTWGIFRIFVLSSDCYVREQAEIREPLHIAQLDTYYENRQFSRMRAYMEKYGLHDDEYLPYRQALEMTDIMEQVRFDCFALSRYSALELEDCSPFLESILREAYQLYSYEDSSSYLLVFSANETLLAEYHAELTATLRNVLHMTALEIQSIQNEDFWQTRYLNDFFAKLERRLTNLHE